MTKQTCSCIIRVGCTDVDEDFSMLIDYPLTYRYIYMCDFSISLMNAVNKLTTMYVTIWILWSTGEIITLTIKLILC